MTLKQYTVNVSLFSENWAYDELFVGGETSATIYVNLPSTGDRLLAFRPDWYSVYISKELEETCHYCIPRIEKDGHFFCRVN